MSKQAITTIAILVLIAGGIYWLSHRHRVRQTRELMLVLASQDQNEAMEAMQKLKAHGIGLYPQLINSINTGVPRVRWRSAVLLGELGDQRATHPLIQLLGDPEPAVRAAAAQTLGRLAAKTAISDLIPLLSNDNDLGVRIAAARALGLLEAEGAVEQLTTALKREEKEIWLGKYQAVPSENYWQLQVAAAQALGAIGTPEAVAGLAEAVDPSQEPDPRVRTAAAYALGDAGVKLQYEEAQLGIIIQALLQAVNDEVGDLRLAPADSKDDGSHIRTAAAHSLGLLTVPENQQETVTQALQQAQSDPHYWVRQATE